MFTKLNVLWVLIFSPSFFITTQGVNAQTLKTETIGIHLLKCKLHKYNKSDPYDFIGRISKEEPDEFSVDDDVAFSIVLLIESIKKDVTVEWVLLWFDADSKSGSGIRSEGVIPEESSPEHSKSGIYAEVSGHRMTIFPLVGHPPKMSKKKGNYAVSILSLDIDNKRFEIEKEECIATFTIR
jgi:hypothetical protein